MSEQWRAEFDAEVTFGNGGGMQVQGFRLDIPGSETTENALGELFVAHLGLLMVERVRVTDMRLINEPHKGSRGVKVDVEHGGRLVDLSHPITDGMVTYPGIAAPRIGDFLSREDSRDVYEPGTEFQIGWIEMASNTGTYLDTPAHRFADGADLSQVDLGSTTDLPGIVVRVTGQAEREIGKSALLPFDVAGKAVLIHTAWSANWGGEAYFSGHPHLSAEAAEWLAESGAALVGIDSLNIDGTGDGARPVHTTLLSAGIPIVEHLCGLEGLPPRGFRFNAAPVAVRGMGTFPVRAYAVLDAAG